MEDYKFLFKVVLIGNSGVGKTCLVRRFTQGVFPKGQGATIVKKKIFSVFSVLNFNEWKLQGVDFMIKTLEIENSAGQREAVKLQIWDTAGQERFRWENAKKGIQIFNGFSRRSITQSYYRSAHALILVYDISCQPTFDALTDWIREIQEYANPKVLKILVGNKTDRDDREIPLRVGEEFAKQHEMYFLETSSKQGENGENFPTFFTFINWTNFQLLFQLNDYFTK